MKRYLILIMLALSMAGAPCLAACDSDCDETCETECLCEKVVVDTCNKCRCKATSKSFFSGRTQFGADSPERRSMFRGSLDARESENACHTGIQAVVFGGQSTNRGDLATYFTPFCKTDLVVKENPDADTDIDARQFNIKSANGNSEFESIISFAPRQSMVGLGLQYRKGIWQNENGHNLWLEVAAPIVNIRNTMGFFEDVINDGGGAATDFVGTMSAAFAQTNWQCGRIDCACPQSRTGLAFLDVMLGYETIKTDKFHLESYIGISAPTGNPVEGAFVFETIVGRNKHIGIMLGSNVGGDIWQSQQNDGTIWWEFGVHSTYLIKNRQRRLLDLKYKPWSRYMQVYKDLAQATEAQERASNEQNDSDIFTPGVNVFCQDVCVNPGFEVSVNSSWVYTRNGFEAELGYNFFYRSPECVQLACGWVEGPALRDASGGGRTNPFATINNEASDCTPNSLADYALSIIKASDLDLESAAHPAYATYNIYGSLGHHWNECEYPYFVGIGGSYEFSRDNTALDRWAAWGKVGASF